MGLGRVRGCAMLVRVWWTYRQVEPEQLRDWSVAVVDCLRATTTIAAALAAGCPAVIPAEDEGLARRWAADRGAVLAGERGCVPPPGFDQGNSPAECTPQAVSGREVVLWTTNGSRALAAVTPVGAEVVAFALVNAGATARHLLRGGCRRLAIVCAGTEGEFSLEDAFAAGALIDRLSGPEGYALRLDERATAALLLYRGGHEDPRAVLDATAAAAKLRQRGLGADVGFASQEDVLSVVPAWRAGALRAADGCAQRR